MDIQAATPAVSFPVPYPALDSIAVELPPAPATLAPSPLQDVTELVSKTVFLKTRFGSLGNSRKVSGSDVLETDADVTLLKVSKQLLESPQLDAIKKADTKMRAWLYNTCLPFDMGVMLLPIGLVDTAVAKMNEYKAERKLLVEAFILAYPALCEGAAAKLGSLYAGSDYPGVDTIRAKFGFDYQIVTFGVPGSLKNISVALFEAEKEKQANQIQGAFEEITAIMRAQLLEMVTHLQTKLTPRDDGSQPILRESAVTNLQEFLKTFDLRNVTDDKQLAGIVAKARELVSGTSAATLRSSDSFREKIRAGMESINSTLSTLVEDKPGRHFREE